MTGGKKFPPRQKRDTAMTPEQRRRNRTLGLILAVIVIAIMAWAFFRAGLTPPGTR